MRTPRAGGAAIAGHGASGLRRLGLVSATVLASVAFISTASAQDRDPASDDVPLGAFTIGTPHDGMSVVEPPQGVPEARRGSTDEDDGSAWSFPGWLQPAPTREVSADALYDQGVKALEAGRSTDAQRLFERLIGEAPDSARATDARQHLGSIYRGAKSDAMPPVLRPAAAVPRADDDGADVPRPVGRTAPGLAKPPTRAELHQARVSPAIDGRFLSEAGDRVFFSAGSADLGIRAQGVIQAQARFLQRYPELSAAIEGYSDDGAIPDEETRRLSDTRAGVVRDRLIAEGVDEVRLVAYGRGREDRVSDCPEPECLAQNRRAVTILLN
ncbi:MAG: OmpA family protein, partial [Hyphomicrobium sp.]|uniref:OmpA family protein n=1 Tax=Hyphomicrobium sp. TaxID=82 RepID=UPI003D0CB40D